MLLILSIKYKIDLADVKNNQQKFKTYLENIKKGNKKHRS